MKGAAIVLHLLSTITFTAAQVQLKKLRDGPFLQNETLGDLLNRMKDYQNVLVRAAQDVASLHRPARSSNDDIGIPTLETDTDFMRSFYPKSGVGNREEVIIEEMKEMDIISDIVGSVQWKYIRFNNTDCLIARIERHIIVWKLQISQYTLFELGTFNAFAVVETEYASIDSIFYTRTTGYDRELYVAVLSDSLTTPTIHIYEIRHVKLIPVTFMHLEERPIKIEFVESQRGSAMVLLISRLGETQIVPKQTGHAHQNMIKIYMQYPIDIVTFSVNGLGYIALANDTYCQVFRFDQYLQIYSLFDRIYVRDIVDLEEFHLGFDRYLLVVGAFEQHIFVWREGGFVPRQLLTAPNVARMHATHLGGCRHDVLLTALGGSSHVPLRLFLWREKEFLPLPDHGLAAIFGHFQSVVGSLESFVDNRTVFLLITDRLGMRCRLFSIKTSVRSLPDPVIIKGSRINEIMKQFETNLYSQEREMRYFHEIFGNAMGSSKTITASQILNNLDVMQETNILLTSLGQMIWQGSTLTLTDLRRWPIDKLEKDLLDLEGQLENLQRIINDAAVNSRGGTIRGHITMHGPVIARHVSLTSLDLLRVGETDIKNLLSFIFRLDRPRQISGRVSFARDFRTRRNMDVDRINSIEVGKDIVLTTKPQDLQGTITFASPFVVDGDLDVEGTVNDLDFSKDLITLHGSHYVPVFKNLSLLHVEHSLTSQLVDNVDLSKLADVALTKNKEQTVFFTPLRVLSGRIGDLKLDGTLNSELVEDLVRRLVRVDRPWDVVGPKHIHRPIFEGGLHVSGLYHRLRFPQDLLLNGHEQTVFSPKYFVESAFKDVIVRGSVDNLKLPDDIVTLTGDEIVSFKVFANGIDARNDLKVGRFIDGVDLGTINNMIRREDRTIRPNVVFVGPTFVKGTLRIANFAGIDLLELSKDLVFPDEEFIELTGKKYFRGETTISSAVVQGSVSGYNLEEDFLNIYKHQIVRGMKIFLHGIEIGGDVITGKNMFGDVDIVDLFNQHISLSTPGTINAKLTLADELFIEDNMQTKGTIDGLALPGNAVLRDGDQYINRKTFLAGITLREVGVDSDTWIETVLNTVDIDELVRRRLTLSTDQTLLGNYLAGDFAASKIEADHLNNVDLMDFVGKVMFITRSQIVPVQFTFPGRTNVFGSIITTQGIDGRRLDRVNLKAVKLYGHIVLPSFVTFASPLIVEGDVRLNRVNDVDLVRLDSDAIKKTIGDFWISGRNVFATGAQIRGNIEAEFVNGVQLPITLLLRHGSQTITGSHHFGNVDVVGHLHNLHLVNGFDLSVLQQIIIRNDRSNNLTGNLILSQSLKVVGHLQTDGLINGIQVSRLPHDAVQKWGVQSIGGKKEILGPVEIISNLHVDYLNGVNLVDFLNDVVFSIGYQEFSSTVTFLNPLVIMAKVAVEGQLFINDLVDGVHLKEFTKNAIFLHEPTVITAVKTFVESTVLLGSLICDGNVNDINLRDAAFSPHQNVPQVLRGSKTFADVFSSSSLEVLGKVNGYNLPMLQENTLMTREWDRRIYGHHAFKGAVNFVSPVVARNAMNLKQEIIFLHRDDRELPGEYIFEGEFNVEGNIKTNGLINEVNLVRLADDALYKNGLQKITGHFRLEDTIVESIAILNGRLNGVPMSLLNKEVDVYHQEIINEERRLMGKIHENQNVAGYLDSVLQSALYTLDYFALHQMLRNFTGDIVQTGNDLTIRAEQSLMNFYWGKGDHFAFANAMPIKKYSQIFFMGQVAHIIHRTETATSIVSGSEELLTTLPKSDVFAFLPFEDHVIIAIGTIDLCRVYKFGVRGIVHEIGIIAVANRIINLRVFGFDGQVYVAVSTDSSTKCLTDGITQLYFWSHEMTSFLQVQTWEGVVKETIPFAYSGMNYLLIVSTNAMQKSYIQLMRKCESVFEDVTQAPPMFGFVDVELFQLGNDREVYLVVANRTHIYIYLLAGINGFHLHSILRATSHITSIRTFLFAQNLYLVVTQGRRSGGALIYLAIMKGSKGEIIFRRWT